MPELFPDTWTMILCMLIVTGSQLIYATIGFGAGMFAISLLALVLHDLTGTVVTLFILTLVTEIGVLWRTWRAARIRLLLGLLPTTVIGLYVGTQLLVIGNTSGLKRVLGAVVLAAGAWFLYGEWRRQPTRAAYDPVDVDCPTNTKEKSNPNMQDLVPTPLALHTAQGSAWWWSVPAGFVAGTLGALFGTGGPPVIACLRAYHLDKSAFRATILWFFLAMSIVRAATYACGDVFTTDRFLAAAWLLPASLVGMAAGMRLHLRLSEHFFTLAVAALLVVLGILLAVGGGRSG